MDVLSFEAKGAASFGTSLSKLSKRLKKLDLRVGHTKEAISAHVLSGTRVALFGSPTDSYEESELKAIDSFVSSGGSALFLLRENQSDDALSRYLSSCGIRAHRDCVVRAYPAPSPASCHHPKEALTTDGVLNVDVHRVSQGLPRGKKFIAHDMSFVYPRGCTLSVSAPASCLLFSGIETYPSRRPLAALTCRGTGRIGVVGSVEFFSDGFIERESNGVIGDVVIGWLLGVNDLEISLNRTINEEVHEYEFVPEISATAERVKSCLQAVDTIPLDLTKLADMEFFSFDNRLLPQVSEISEALGLDKNLPHISLIKPNLAVPFPELEPALFPPLLNELVPPGLELFDLDDAFADEHVKLAQLANRCGPDDLEVFIKEAGIICGLGSQGGKDVIREALKTVGQFKSSN